MKKLIFVLFTTISLSTAYGQLGDIKTPNEGKSLIYFVKYRGDLSATKFKFFDGENYMGMIANMNYFTYECEPGEHIFWATNESSEFIKADLKPNCVYLIEVKPKLRIAITNAKLYAINPSDEEIMVKVRTVLTKTESELNHSEKEISRLIKKGMKRYKNVKDNIAQINSDWTFYCGN